MKIQKKQKKLILRLSSLGDVILSTSALSVFSNKKENCEIHWVVAKEFANILENHPLLDRLYIFDRKLGLKAWYGLAKVLWNEKFSEVYDLHNTLRTKILKVFFIFFSVKNFSRSPQWKTISKQRIRLYGYFIFKSLWPKFFLPTPWIERYTKRVNGLGNEKPNLIHLIKKPVPIMDEEKKILDQVLLKKFVCIMPSSKWDGKKWPVVKYLELIEKMRVFPVILGTSNDFESITLTKLLTEKNISHFSAVEKWNINQTAYVLSKAESYLGCDTGLAHLAEAVGTQAIIIYGPTTPEMGFGPWKKESQSLGVNLICRPCSKDGSICYRFGQRYECLNRLSVEHVIKGLGQKENDLFKS